MPNPYITPDLFDFLRDLKANNDRDWFEENRWRYEEHVKEPLLDFIADFGPLLSTISPHYLAIPKIQGGSLFRIYRDMRFSKNKKPYKTHAGVHFRHRGGKDVHAPGYYLHLEPDNVFVALGIWRPPVTPVLTQIRNRIVDHPEEWEQVASDSAFAEQFELSGDTLTRMPRGFSDDDPHAEDLKRKDFIGVCELPAEELMTPDVVPKLHQIWSQGSPLMAFISRALDVPF